MGICASADASAGAVAVSAPPAARPAAQPQQPQPSPKASDSNLNGAAAVAGPSAASKAAAAAAVGGSASKPAAPIAPGAPGLLQKRGSVMVLSSEMADVLGVASNPHQFMYIENELLQVNSYHAYFGVPPYFRSAGADYGSASDITVRLTTPAASHVVPPEVKTLVDVTRDWNGQYQDALTMLRPDSKVTDRVAYVAFLCKLVKELSTVSTTFARVVADEFWEVDSKKNVRPIFLGLDRTKLIANSIYLRVVAGHANDERFTTTEYARKIFRQHQLGMQCFANIHPDLRTTMMSLVDYRGQRLVGFIIMPELKVTTMKYGSNDRGHTVYKSDRVAQLMEGACARFGLKPHKIGFNKKTEPITVACNADIEVHKGKIANFSEGAYYVIGTTRTLPPTRPYRYDPGVIIPDSPDQPLYAINVDPKQAARDIRQALAFAISHDKADEGNQLDLRPIDTDSNSLLVHTGQGPVNDRATKLVGTEVRGPAVYVRRQRNQFMYRRFRPEFLNLYASLPAGGLLSSDAYSAFGMHNFREHNRNIDDATDYLLNTLVPRFAKDIAAREPYVRDGRHLCDLMHERGINVRYLPFVRNSVPLHCGRERRIITTEMVTRFAKHALQWRMRETRSSDDRVLAVVISRFLNTVFGDSETSDFFWKVQVPIGVRQLFHHVLTIESPEVYSLEVRKWVDLSALFVDLQVRAGFVMEQGTQQRYLENPASFNREAPFQARQIAALIASQKIFYWSSDLLKTAIAEKFSDKKGAVRQKYIHIAVGEICGETSVEFAESHFQMASSILREKELALGGAVPEVDDMTVATLETAWEHTEHGWAIVGHALGPCDTKIAYLLLRARLLELLSKEEKAKQEYRMCLINLAMAYGDPNEAMLAIQQPQAIAGKACGNPLFLVIANRLAHLHSALGEPVPASLVNAATVALKLYPLPEDSKVVEQVFFEPLPLVVQQVAEHAGVTVESFLSEARTAAIQRALSGPEAPTDRVTLAKDMDSLFAAEVAKFRNVDALFKVAAYASSAVSLCFPPAEQDAQDNLEAASAPAKFLISQPPPMSPNQRAGRRMSQQAMPDVKEVPVEDAKEAVQFPDHTLAQVELSAPGDFDVFDSWCSQPVGAYVKMRTLEETHSSTDKFEQVVEQLTFLAAKSADEVTLIRCDMNPSSDDETKGQTTVLRRTPKTIAEAGAERLVVDGHYVDCVKFNVNTVSKSPETTTTTDAVVWVPVDPALKQRVCHPIKQTVKVSTTTSTGFTTTTEYMDKMLVLSEVFGLPEDRVLPCFAVKRQDPAVEASSAGENQWLRSSQVPGGVVHAHEIVNRGDDERAVSLSQLIGYGVLSADEITTWRTKYHC